VRVVNVSVRDAAGLVRVNEASLSVRGGEIVGVAAVEGAGQRELLRLLAGRVLAEKGEVELPARVGFVPEDRHNDALMLDRSLVENVALRNAGTRTGRMPWSELRDATRGIIAEQQVRAGGEDIHVRTLSGGNQQKLIVGRELAETPEALIVENPTRGLDFRATSAVHDALRVARAAGTAVVVYSSDLDEVLQLADRVVVMHAGHLVEVPRDRELIGRAMLGA
jgi:simple sugar transport system ATP-binding protein